jgi:hypothetical protein
MLIDDEGVRRGASVFDPEAGLFVDIGWHHPDAHAREEYEGYLVSDDAGLQGLRFRHGLSA